MAPNNPAPTVTIIQVVTAVPPLAIETGKPDDDSSSSLSSPVGGGSGSGGRGNINPLDDLGGGPNRSGLHMTGREAGLIIGIVAFFTIAIFSIFWCRYRAIRQRVRCGDRSEDAAIEMEGGIKEGGDGEGGGGGGGGGKGTRFLVGAFGRKKKTGKGKFTHGVVPWGEIWLARLANVVRWSSFLDLPRHRLILIVDIKRSHNTCRGAAALHEMLTVKKHASSVMTAMDFIIIGQTSKWGADDG